MSNTVLDHDLVRAFVTWTPAATSHTAGDSVGGAQTFILPNATGRIVKLRSYNFSMSTTTPVTSTYRAFFYNATPTVIADDAAFVVNAADGAKLLGYIDIIQPLDFTGVWQQCDHILATPKAMKLVSDTVTVYLVNNTTATYEAVAHNLEMYFDIIS